MAIDANSYFSIAANGQGAATAGGFNKFQLDATPKFPLGFQIVGADGSIYRYAHMGAATNRGVVVAQDVSETSVVDTDNVVIAPASAVAVADQPNIKPGALGSFYVQLTLAAVTSNQFRGAKFITTDDTGEGYTYDVIGNTATDTPATGDIRLTLAQPIQVALDTTTDIAIRGSQYSDLELATTTDECVAGVTCSTTTTALPYAWIQTKGVCGILQDGTIALGDVITLSDGTAGAVQALGGGGTDVTDVISEPILGYCVDPGDSTGHGSFKINLE